MSLDTAAVTVSEGKGMGIIINVPQNPSGALTVYSTLDRKPANDMADDLIKSFAKGLEKPSGAVYFRAKEGIGLEPVTTERPQDLSFMSWVRYAQHQIDNNPIGQRTEVEAGSVDQEMICTTRDGGFSPHPAIDLMPGWREFSDSELTATRTSFGANITRSGNSPGTNVITVGALTPLGIKRWNRKLLMEVVALGRENAVQPFRFLVQPGDNSIAATAENPEGGQFSSSWNQGFEIDWNAPTRLIVDLDRHPEYDLLKTIAISGDPQQLAAWPAGATLVVTKLLLVENNDPRIGNWKNSVTPVGQAPVDLLSRWWAGDLLRDNDAARVRTKFDGARGKRSFKMTIEESDEAREAGRGGPIFPSLFLDSESCELEVVVKSFKPSQENGKSCRLIVWMQAAGDEEVGYEGKMISQMRTIEKKQINKQMRFALKTSGFADYFAILTDAAEIEFSLVKIVPKNR